MLILKETKEKINEQVFSKFYDWSKKATEQGIHLTFHNQSDVDFANLPLDVYMDVFMGVLAGCIHENSETVTELGKLKMKKLRPPSPDFDMISRKVSGIIFKAKQELAQLRGKYKV